MKDIKLSNGFECKVDERIANDFELIQMLADAKKDVTVYPEVVLKIFGEKQTKKLFESLRKDGIVPTANLDGKTYSMADAVADAVMAAGGDVKN